MERGCDNNHCRVAAETGYESAISTSRQHLILQQQQEDQ